MTIPDRVDAIFRLLGLSGRWKQAVIQHFEEAIREDRQRVIESTTIPWPSGTKEAIAKALEEANQRSVIRKGD